MPVNSVNSNTYIASTIENPNNDANINAYNELSNQWSAYSSNEYLSDKFKEDIQKKLEELKGLVNVAEEEKKNEEIAELIAGLKAIINGSDSMISLSDRVKCLESLSVFKTNPKSQDLSEASYESIKDKLNIVDSTYKNTLDFHKELYSNILDKYSGRLDETVKNNLQDWIDGIVKEESVDIFYKKIIEEVCAKEKDRLKESDSNALTTNTYSSLASFFKDLTKIFVSYSVYQTEQDNIFASSRASLRNQTLSMKVMQESNAYKLLEIDNFMSEELNKRAEMDPALKRLRDGIYWTDNKEVKAQDSINSENELWTKKQE